MFGEKGQRMTPDLTFSHLHAHTFLTDLESIQSLCTDLGRFMATWHYPGFHPRWFWKGRIKLCYVPCLLVLIVNGVSYTERHYISERKRPSGTCQRMYYLDQSDLSERWGSTSFHNMWILFCFIPHCQQCTSINKVLRPMIWSRYHRFSQLLHVLGRYGRNDNTTSCQSGTWIIVAIFDNRCP